MMSIEIFSVLLCICEEAWEKGPIASKYCFEKNTFKVSQIFTKEAWEKEPIASKYCFVKTHLKKIRKYLHHPINRSPSSNAHVCSLPHAQSHK